MMKEADLERLPSGGTRWEKSVRWARQLMVYEGLLSSESPHGIWEITPKGRAYLAQLRAKRLPARD